VATTTVFEAQHSAGDAAVQRILLAGAGRPRAAGAKP
jgi:hypothetical protein